VYTRQTTVCNKSGLHARPAADLVKKAVKFKSAITINKKEQSGAKVNIKSLVLVLSLSIACGCRIEISAEGEDEREAVDELITTVDSGFGEKE
jgi:phosphocarrier protein HPr